MVTNELLYSDLQFDAEHYYNSCTMKSCCFAGDNDQFVLSGSDDFNLYMWKIPENNSSGEKYLLLEVIIFNNILLIVVAVHHDFEIYATY